MDFEAEEERDGVRFAWNVWPNTRLEGSRLVVPIGCLYSPMKSGSLNVQYEPVTCRGQNCRGVLNPFCAVDFRSKFWNCPFCLNRNPFPPSYADINENNLPAELIPQYTTMEYVLTNRATPPPVFLFLVDRCVDSAELQELKNGLIMALNLLPENALIGLITIGRTVHVYELGFEEMPRAWVFAGNKDVSGKQLQELLGFPPRHPNQPVQINPQGNRFLMPVSQAEFTITNILEELQPDPSPKSDRRPSRSTGAALSVAVSLLETTFQNSGARIMLFTGGPCTVGPGLVVSDDLREPLRSHSDISKGSAKYASSATKYYNALALRAVQNGHAIDMFACSLDQEGVHEMQEIVKRTGGYIVLADAFEGPMFKQSFQKIFNRDDKGFLKMGFNATIEVQTSRELKVCGAIGHCTSVQKKTPNVSETIIGMGDTSAWKICGLDTFSTFALYFEVVNQQPSPVAPGSRGMIQFQTTYQNAHGQKVMRVTTLGRPWADPAQGNAPLLAGFDQEAAAVLMSRNVIFKAESEDTFDVLRWLDRMLIRLMAKFAEFRKDDISSFRVAQQMTIYPQFMFHLRRSKFLQVFNNSPDETAFFRYMLLRENVSNTLIMIQPTLEAYSFSGPPVPVLLASTSVQLDRILLLDSFFTVVVHHGETIAHWRDAGYANDPQYENLKHLLAAPKDDAQAIMKNRFPMPRYVECDQHKSQARFLLASIDPVITHTTASASNKSGEVVFTDDVSLKVFMEHLKKLVVSS